MHLYLSAELLEKIDEYTALKAAFDDSSRTSVERATAHRKSVNLERFLSVTLQILVSDYRKRQLPPKQQKLL